jgi:hypothetical protein
MWSAFLIVLAILLAIVLVPVLIGILRDAANPKRREQYRHYNAGIDMGMSAEDALARAQLLTNGVTTIQPITASANADALYYAAVEVFNKATAQDDVTKKLLHELSSRKNIIEKKEGDQHSAARSVLYGCAHLVRTAGNSYDGAIMVLAVGSVVAVSVTQTTDATDPEMLRASAIEKINLLFRDDDVKAVAIGQFGAALEIGKNYGCLKTAALQLEEMAERLVRIQPPLEDTQKYLATLFVVTAVLVTFGFSNGSN